MCDVRGVPQRTVVQLRSSPQLSATFWRLLVELFRFTLTALISCVFSCSTCRLSIKRQMAKKKQTKQSQPANIAEHLEA